MYSYLFGLVLVCFSSLAFCMEEVSNGPDIAEPSSKITKFKFTGLTHEKGDPESYTLMCLDSGLIPASEKLEKLKKNTEFEPIKNWLRKELLENSKHDDSAKKLRVVTRELAGGNNYYLVWLHLKPQVSASEHFTTRLWGGTIRHIEEHEYSASMLIFPQSSSTQALVYLLGEWSQLLNPHAVIHDWGLRLAATQAIFSDENIKILLGKNNFDPNPTSRREKKQRLAPIESFALEVGTEGLQSLTVLPKYALGAKHQRLVVGSDWYNFFLSEVEEGKKGDTVSSLVSMANYLYGVYRNDRKIHPKLQDYLDDEVTDLETITALNQRLSYILPTDAAKLKVFPVDTLWKYYGRSPEFSYNTNKRKKYLLEAFKGQNVTLDSLVSIKKAKKKTKYKEPISRMIYSLPIEFNEGFYRFDRGRWFKVASTRFNPIIRKMRHPSIKTTLEALSPYTLEDAMGDDSKEDGGHYQEDRYNRRVIAELAGKKQSGILLDRLNVYFSGQGNKFEFGDILLHDDKGQYHIIHVKRKEAGDIDHHRAQVERCAEYLATELKKENAKDLLLQGCVNGLYLRHGVAIKKVKGQGKRLTRGDTFKKVFANKKRGKKQWETYLKNDIFHNAKGQSSSLLGKFKIALRKINLGFFENHQEELIVALDALYDCKSDKDENLTGEEIQDFFEALKQLIKIKTVLFPKGVLTEAIRKKTTLVMAVIDDRQIESIREVHKAIKKIEQKKKDNKSKKTKTLEELKLKLQEITTKDRSSETEVFKKQQLWGLDRTRQLVQKYGFHFNLTVINENTERPDWDAFGSTLENTSIEEGGESTPEETGTKSVPQKKTVQSKTGKKGSVDLSDQEESSDDQEELPEQQDIAGYQYTSTDINRLLHAPLSQNLPQEVNYLRFSLSGGADDAEADTNDIVHRFNNRYVLPPIISHKDEHEEKSPSETLIDLLTNSFFTHPEIGNHPPAEMIIPFNPGGHWVTFHIVIPPEGTIDFRYIDSLPDSSTREARLPLAFLKGKYFPRTINFAQQFPRLQPDGTSCGAVVVENTKDLFHGNPLPDPYLISLADMLALKEEHREHLKSIDKDFDF